MALPSVSEIEQAGLKAWPAIDTATDGQWVMRAAGGYTKRANSIQCLDPEDDGDVPARLDRASRWFRDRQLPPVFRVTPLTGPAIVAELERSWTLFEPSRVLAMVFGPSAFAADPNTALYPVTSSEWLDAQQHLQGYDDGTLQRLRRVVERIRAPAKGFVHYGEDARPSATALMDVVNGIAVIGNVITDKEQRRRGYARRLLQTGLAWARQAGARRAALAVLATNEAALALYRGLGFEPAYDYHYRRLGP